jgi:hypothetical protein
MSAPARRGMVQRPAEGLGRLRQQPYLALAGVALGVGVLYLRLVGLDSAPFIFDEPRFLEAARQQLVTGQWSTSSPIPGNQGVTYGATVVWFYGITEWLLGPAPLPNIAAMCLVVTTAQVIMVVSVSRTFRIGAWGCAVLLLFAASSSYLFVWARLAWDQTTLLIPFLVIALLCTRRVNVARAGVIGVLLGLGLSSHPMILPFLVVVLGTLAVENRRSMRRLLSVVGAAGGAVCLVCVPWFLSLRGGGEPAGSTTPFRVDPGRLLEGFQTAGFWRFDYFLDQDWSDFVAGLPLPGDPTSWGVLCMSAAALLVVFGTVLIRSPDPAQRRVVVVMLVVAVLHPLFLDWRNTLHDPHYYFPLAWLPYVGGAAVLSRLRAAGPSARGALLATTGGILVVTVVQLVFVLAFRSYVVDRGGTQGVHYGTAVALQTEAVRTACLRAGTEPLFIDNRTAIFDQALRYQIRTIVDCTGRQVTPCTAPCPPAVRTAILAYRGPNGGAVDLLGP